VQRLVAERLAEQGGCPHCGYADVVKFGTTQGAQRCRCKGCGKTFTATTGTPFHRLRDKTKLLENAACLADGLSIRKTAQRLGFSVDKTFRWRHKFPDFLSRQQPAVLTGVVEADETMFVRSYKGWRKGLPRVAKKRAGPPKEGGVPTKRRF
jgi:transposase-like protein